MERTVDLFKANHKTTNSGHLISDGFKIRHRNIHATIQTVYLLFQVKKPQIISSLCYWRVPSTGVSPVSLSSYYFFYYSYWRFTVVTFFPPIKCFSLMFSFFSSVTVSPQLLLLIFPLIQDFSNRNARRLIRAYNICRPWTSIENIFVATCAVLTINTITNMWIQWPRMTLFVPP